MFVFYIHSEMGRMKMLKDLKFFGMPFNGKLILKWIVYISPKNAFVNGEIVSFWHDEIVTRLVTNSMDVVSNHDIKIQMITTTEISSSSKQN